MQKLPLEYLVARSIDIRYDKYEVMECEPRQLQWLLLPQNLYCNQASVPDLVESLEVAEWVVLIVS